MSLTGSGSFAFATPTSAQSGVTGTWIIYDFGGAVIDLQANGAAVTGTVSRSGDVMTIYDGTVAGNTVTFKAISHGGNRENTYTGRLNGEQMFFTRSVEVLPGGVAVGTGIFGSGGPMEFVASRDSAAGLTVPRALLGSWKQNLQRSTFPGRAPRPVVPDVRAYVSRPGGGLLVAAVQVSEEGTPRARIKGCVKERRRTFPLRVHQRLPG